MDYELLSSSLGYLSILCWLGAQFPQVIVNFQTQSVEGLALPFLANWLFGDITNLVGCILTHQLPFQTYLASYFVFVDLSLVAQYIYYYKPPIPYTPSASSSPSLSPTLTLTPTAVVYSARSLTRPTSRTRLLDRGFGELESGVRLSGYGGVIGRARSAPRLSSGSRGFSGVLSAYPPPGLLPSSDQIASTSGTIKGRPSIASNLDGELRMKKKRKSKEREASEQSAQEQEEEEDEVSALADSFYSDVSAPGANGRHVSWSRATAERRPPVRSTTSGSLHSLRMTSSEGEPLIVASEEERETGGETTPTQTMTAAQSQAAQEELSRQRSRSRGRPSTRNRAGFPPMLTYEYASPNEPSSPVLQQQQILSASTGLLQPLTAPADLQRFRHQQQQSEPSTSASAGRQEFDERERQRLSERDSKSGSRRRSASIVFLSAGLGALIVMGGGSSPSSSISTSDRWASKSAEGRIRGQVFGSIPLPQSSSRTWEAVYLHSDDGYLNSENNSPKEGKKKEKDAKARKPHQRPPLTPEEKRQILGRISAWACTILYLTSRLPQIWKNYTRKSVQGLSLALFVFAFLGNTFYVASILSTPILWEYPPDTQPIHLDLTTPGLLSSSLLQSEPKLPPPSVPPYDTPRARAFLRESLPYLLGSAGTLCFDVVIVTQGIIYGRRELLEDEEDSEDEEEGDEEVENSEDGEDEEGRGKGKVPRKDDVDEVSGDTELMTPSRHTDRVIDNGG